MLYEFHTAFVDAMFTRQGKKLNRGILFQSNEQLLVYTGMKKVRGKYMTLAPVQNKQKQSSPLLLSWSILTH